jgi:formylglycine-generating enzyme required for sulfatase activity
MREPSESKRGKAEGGKQKAEGGERDSAFSVQHSAFSIQHSAFSIPLARAWPWLLILAVLAGPSCRRVQSPQRDAQPPQIIRTKSGVEMVLIPAGRFTMGSDSGAPDQAPAHEVWIDAFLMDRHEMTQEVYGKLVQPNGSHFKGPQRPVEMISWAEAALYCNKRSRAEGLEPCYNEQTAKCDFRANGYRLPTEAEWEYACRAGTGTSWSFGNDPGELRKHAWLKDNADKTTHPVMQKAPNPWGLYDMHGNVAEWCNDVYDKDYYKTSPKKNPQGPAEGDKYVLRGGAWNSSPPACGSAYRVGEEPGFQDACFARDAIGFRCVRRAPENLSSAIDD